jgi:hypothetical protein
LIKPVQADSNIYIRVDSLMYPSPASILVVGNSIYNLTNNNTDSIVEKDDIIFEGANRAIQGIELENEMVTS